MEKIIVYVIMFLFCITIHELGHYLTAIALGIKVKKITFGTGKLLFISRFRGTYFVLRLIPLLASINIGIKNRVFTKQEMLMVFASGPMANILLGLALVSLSNIMLQNMGHMSLLILLLSITSNGSDFEYIHKLIQDRELGIKNLIIKG